MYSKNIKTDLNKMIKYFTIVLTIFTAVFFSFHSYKNIVFAKNYNSEYNRDSFVHWIDIDNDTLDAREQALQEQSGSLKLSSSGQEKIINFWICPYTAKIIIDSSKLDADHIVPLKWAWDHGANEWSNEKKILFANDQLNIFIVEAGSNRSKGADGPESWLPPNMTFARMYIERFMQVCEKYDLYYPEKIYNRLLSVVDSNRKGIDSKLLLR